MNVSFSKKKKKKTFYEFKEVNLSIKLSSLRATKKKWSSKEELGKNLKNMYIYKRKIRVWKFQKENEYIYIHTHIVSTLNW